MTSFKIKPRPNKTRCPYCFDDLSGELVECEACSATHHSECWNYLQVCAACKNRNSLQSLKNLQIALRKRRKEFNLDMPSLSIGGFFAFIWEFGCFLADLALSCVLGLLSLCWGFVSFGFFAICEILGGLIAFFAEGAVLMMEVLVFCIPVMFLIAFILLFIVAVL